MANSLWINSICIERKHIEIVVEILCAMRLENMVKPNKIYLNLQMLIIAIMAFFCGAHLSWANEQEKEAVSNGKFKKNNAVVNKIQNETGGSVLNITNKPSQEGKDEMRVKIIKNGHVKIIDVKDDE